MIVDGFTMIAADFQSCQTVVIQTHSSLSAVDNFGRFTERWSTPIW